MMIHQMNEIAPSILQKMTKQLWDKSDLNGVSMQVIDRLEVGSKNTRIYGAGEWNVDSDSS